MAVEPNKNLPLQNLPLGAGSSVGRAQDFFSVNLGRESIKNAKVSMNQVMMNSNQPLTSISHPGGAGQKAVTSINNLVSNSNSPTTSVFHPSTATKDERNNLYDEGADDRRYNYIQRLIRARKNREVAIAEKEAKSPRSKFKIEQGTGASFSRRVWFGGLDKKLRKMFYKDRATFKNLSKADRTFFADLVEKHAQARRTGVGYVYRDRRNMRLEIEKARRKRIISWDDSKDFKKMINELE